jgi:hypothetical protein
METRNISTFEPAISEVPAGFSQCGFIKSNKYISNLRRVQGIILHIYTDELLSIIELEETPNASWSGRIRDNSVPTFARALLNSKISGLK